jgi:hypothetical protein
MKKTMIISTILLFSLLAVYAGEGSTTVKGKLVCIGCTLKKHDGAAAQCSIFGHKHGLQTSTGAIYNFIENEKSKDVINTEKWHNANVQVTGKIHHVAQMISLEKFEVLK